MLTERFPIPGSCYITVEAAGGVSPQPIFAVPYEIWVVANALVEFCVEREAVGGFSTLDFGVLTDWAANSSTNSQAVGTATADSPNGIPSDVRYLSVTVGGSNTRFAPGDTDPMVAVVLSEMNNIAAQKLSLPSGGLGGVNTFTPTSWLATAKRMQRGSTTPWWQVVNSQVSDQMTYECDANLGSPPALDCAQLEWSQLGDGGSPSDILTVGPEATFYHSNTCFLSISATVTTTLSWEQIRVASTTLMELCVERPYAAPQGGRAYFGSQPKGVGGRKDKRLNKILILSGTNALPPRVTMSIFHQSEGWKSTVDELNSCTWQAVLNGHPTSTCPAG